MKKTFVFLLLALGSVTYSQARVFYPGAKFDMSASLSDPGATSNFKFMADFRLSPNFRLGPGVSIGAMGFAVDQAYETEKQMLAAYGGFIGFKWIPSSQRRVSFLLSGEAGLVFDERMEYRYAGEDWDGYFIDALGPTALIAPGIDIALRRGSLQVTTELRWQRTAWGLYQNGDDYTSETFFGIGIAYQWGQRR